MSDLAEGSRILVVDDEVTLSDAIARRLRRAGHTVTIANDAFAALALCELGQTPFDLVVTDVHMPGMTGLDLATALIERRPMQRVLIMTGDPDEMLQRAALSRGSVSFLPKPFDGDAMVDAVDVALKIPRQMVTPPPVAQRAYREAAIGTVPAEWLLWTDERSSAGAGHGDRVARMARVIALSWPEPMSFFSLAELEVAAWSHEIGLLAGPTANPAEMAWRSSEILKDCGSNDLVVALVRNMHEHWDGSGGPERLRGESIPLGAQILSAADSIDHYCAAWLRTGADPATAANRAIKLVLAQEDTCFSPQIVEIVKAQRTSLGSVCGVERRERVEDLTHRPERDLPEDLTSRFESFVS
jgi:putative two-component system response regulator